MGDERKQKDRRKPFPASAAWIVFIGIGSLVVLLTAVYRTQAWDFLIAAYTFFSDREAVQRLIVSFNGWAPFIFILFQFLQVLFAPVPGEATGLIGGYLFGVFPGFLYSGIGLTLGSWVNFLVGRLLGRKYIRKLIPKTFLDRFEPLLRRQGILVLFILFIFPGFPKDYLCLFLGLSTLPIKVFMIISTIGRMPGTLMLSLQGAYIYERLYGLFAIILGISMVVVFLTYRYRNSVYRYIERSNHESRIDDASK